MNGLSPGFHPAWLLALWAAILFSCKGDSTAPVQPVIGMSESSIAFEATTGGAAPSARTVEITNTGAGSLADLAVSVAYGAGASGWLVASLSTSTAPSTLTLTPVISALPAGSFNATVSVSSAAASNSPQTVSVHITLLATFGNYQDHSAYASVTYNRLLAIPINVTDAVSLTHLGLIGRIAGPVFKMGLYTDQAGDPGQLVAAVNDISLEPGRKEVAVASTALPPGQYWLAAVFNGPAAIGRTNISNATVKSIELGFNNSLPTVWPGGHFTQVGNHGYNFFIKGRLP